MLNRFCRRCGHDHRFLSGPYIRCFGIEAKRCNLYYENDRIEKVIGHSGPYLTWPVKTGQSLREFVDDYEKFFNIGITVRDTGGGIRPVSLEEKIDKIYAVDLNRKP